HRLLVAHADVAPREHGEEAAVANQLAEHLPKTTSGRTSHGGTPSHRQHPLPPPKLASIAPTADRPPRSFISAFRRAPFKTDLPDSRARRIASLSDVRARQHCPHNLRRLPILYR